MSNSEGEQESYNSSQEIVKESMGPSLEEESPMVNELLQARIEVEESDEDIFDDDPCDSKSKKKVEKVEWITLFEESEKEECLKEKEFDLDKSEGTKEIESLSAKQSCCEHTCGHDIPDIDSKGLLDKSRGKSVESFSSMKSSVETFLFALSGINYFENHVLNVNGPFENPYGKHEILIGKSWDLENNQSYTFSDEFLDFMSKSSLKKGLSNWVLDNLSIFKSILGLYVDSILELYFGFARPCELKSSWNSKKNFDLMRFNYFLIHDSFLKYLENKILNFHVPFKAKCNILGIHGWVLGFENDENSRTNPFEGGVIRYLKRMKRVRLAHQIISGTKFGLRQFWHTFINEPYNFSYTYPNDMIQASIEDRGTSYSCSRLSTTKEVEDRSLPWTVSFPLPPTVEFRLENIIRRITSGTKDRNNGFGPHWSNSRDELKHNFRTPLISSLKDKNMEFDDAMKASVAVILEQGPERMTEFVQDDALLIALQPKHEGEVDSEKIQVLIDKLDEVEVERVMTEQEEMNSAKNFIETQESYCLEDSRYTGDKSVLLYTQNSTGGWFKIDDLTTKMAESKYARSGEKGGDQVIRCWNHLSDLKQHLGESGTSGAEEGWNDTSCEGET
ncbi:hypothetical protein M9H77_29647 [Catharanthus roseus]|uniref:Uncharacterized protein n=1 Tax=Catharanthus roseus TaxID=4058 RepID=A0ACB9ZWV8_CATRO|nr:hypothetical protein M9H77_29647 [Catharanthus roseus]